MSFKLWIESNNDSIFVPFQRMIMTRSELFSAAENIARGYPSMTEGPVEVVDMGQKRYQLVNGYHRIIPVMLSGAVGINATVDTSAGKRPWNLPKDRFRYMPELPYKGLEKFLEVYLLKRL